MPPTCASRVVLVSIPMEGVSESDLRASLDDLLALAQRRGIATGLYDFAWHSRYESTESDNLSDLANDFVAAGYRVDFDDGPCITIYEAPREASDVPGGA